MRHQSATAVTSSRVSPIVGELRSLAQEVRRIGSSLRSDPETIAIQKDDIASRLRRLARQLEVAL